MAGKYGFIGCGNMGGALARSLAKAVEPKEIMAADNGSGKAAALENEIGLAKATAKEIATQCKYIFLGVKPQGMAKMLADIKDILEERSAKGERFIIITMAAGMTIQKIRELAGNWPMVRIMPNLPVSVGEGMTLYCVSDISQQEKGEFLELMKYSGELCELDEKLIDAGSAVSGCGPAFVFMFIEALADGGVKCGLPRNKAQQLAAQTVLGSAKLLLETEKHPGELKDAVCSPGGTTIAGVMALEKGAFRADSAQAVIKAYERTLEIAGK